MVFFERNDALAKEVQLPARYNQLTPYDRLIVREAYMNLQKGLCYYCHGSLYHVAPEDVREKKVTPKLYPPGFFDRSIHLHHDHQTDLTLGAVHAYCNAVLWEYHNE